MKLALEEWRHWLEGAEHPFFAWTDDKNLEYIKKAKRLNSRQARWALFFDRFSFSLSYNVHVMWQCHAAMSSQMSCHDYSTPSRRPSNLKPSFH